MAEPSHVVPSDIDQQALAELIDAVRNKHRIELEARDRVARARTRHDLAIASRRAAEDQLHGYMSQLVTGGTTPTVAV